MASTKIILSLLNKYEYLTPVTNSQNGSVELRVILFFITITIVLCNCDFHLYEENQGGVKHERAEVIGKIIFPKTRGISNQVN